MSYSKSPKVPKAVKRMFEADNGEHDPNVMHIPHGCTFPDHDSEMPDELAPYAEGGIVKRVNDAKGTKKYPV